MTPLANNIRRVSGADGAVVLDLHRGTMFRLNPLGARVLDLLDEGEPLPRIAIQLSTEFGVALNVVETDIEEFLDALKRHGVLDPRGPKA